ncbi:ParE family toxin-like protein [Nitrospira sp. T9]|uniref:ParE family toxin-like protein n=1 Tax=unclassified Nitrospira TaxID=2652172 RepID=UPI003F973522
MNHYASPEFWFCYRSLPSPIQVLADKAFEQLKTNPRHPSLHFKKVTRYWSARVGLHYRAIGVDVSDGVLWFWIGIHADYDKLLR